MTISVWRYSHLALAISSFLLLSLASVTGVILAFQPVTEKIQPYRAAALDTVTLAQTLPLLRKTYPGISELTVDAHQFVQIKGSDTNGKELLAYVDPTTGKILGKPKPADEFFQWVTALHRSLFIHETGRFFIGLTAFLLLLITVSGTMLIIQRQRGVKRFFTKIARDNFAQFYHVVLGRWSLIPIFIIALSGTYLSLARFGLIDINKATDVDFDNIKSSPVRNPADFEIFKQTKLSQVESIEFPFSEDVEDYYTIKLKTGEVAINQVNGDVLSEVKYPNAVMLTNLSLDLHTGRASIIWAVILAVASANILFFIYSGFAITWKRISNRTRNKYKADESKFIILVGSENGNTFSFAQALHQQLLKKGERPYITQLNDYKVFPNAAHIIVMTATYGLGDAPTNATKFASLLQKHPQVQTVSYSVLGFGSHAYADFCKYAFEVDQLLAAQPWATALTDIHTVNDRSPEEFGLWAEAWSQQANVQLTSLQLHNTNNNRLETFTVANNTAATRADGTFTISLKGRRRIKVTSGDLLAIYPANDHRERLYSIGVVDGQIRLSVRLQPNGLGSGFLHRLISGEKLRARVVTNKHFHFPEQAREVLMIANGTGIAPFIGMISQNTKNIICYLYCGFREQASYTAYQDLLLEGKATGKLRRHTIAFSREGKKQYVSDLIKNDTTFVADVLERGGVLMICGSLAMQKDVLELLETICSEKTGHTLSYYRSHDQIRTDCY